jgi:type III restriction enzyme
VATPELYDLVDRIYSFRNEFIAHQERELSDAELARQALVSWIEGLSTIYSLAGGAT